MSVYTNIYYNILSSDYKFFQQVLVIPEDMRIKQFSLIFLNVITKKISTTTIFSKKFFELNHDEKTKNHSYYESMHNFFHGMAINKFYRDLIMM